MHRFFVPTKALEKSPVVISGAEARHMSTVLRLKPGNRIILMDGQGHVVSAAITACGKGRVETQIIARLPPSGESPLRLSVAQAFLKTHKMDSILRHLTELGVQRWLPFASRRSVAKPSGDRLQHRVKRWRDITKEAVKQCRRSRLPDIRPAENLRQVLEVARDDNLKIIFWEAEKKRLSGIIDTFGRKSHSIFLIIGPEGGFSTEEIRTATAHGFATAGLGPRILRAETAALAVGALIQYTLGDMG